MDLVFLLLIYLLLHDRPGRQLTQACKRKERVLPNLTPGRGLVNSSHDAKCGSPFPGRAGKSHCWQFIQQWQSCQKPALQYSKFTHTFSCSYRCALSGHRQMMWGQMGCASPREDHPKEKPQSFSSLWMTQPFARLFSLFLLKTPNKTPLAFFPHSCCCSLAEVKELGKSEP